MMIPDCGLPFWATLYIEGSGTSVFRSAVSSRSGVWGRAPTGIKLSAFSLKMWHLVASF